MSGTARVRQAVAADAEPLLALMRELARFEGYDEHFTVTAADLCERGLAPVGAPQFVAFVAEQPGGELAHQREQGVGVRSPGPAHGDGHATASWRASSAKPSSSQPVTPPIMILAGRPRRASRIAPRVAPLQCGPAQ